MYVNVHKTKTTSIFIVNINAQENPLFKIIRVYLVMFIYI